MTAARARWTSIAVGGAIVLVALLAYLPALPGGFVWDDDSWTTKLVGLFRDASGLRAIWFKPTAMQQYYPLTGTTFWMDYQLWKLWAPPRHLENVLLHASAALLFWRSLLRLRVPGAWLASAIFALHPVMVESVAWITERKNVLSLTLCLGAFLAYLRHAQDGSDDTAGPTRAVSGAYVLAWFLFVGALLAKTTVCTFPAAVLLIAWWQRGRIRWRQDVLPMVPFFAAAIAMGAVTAWLEKTHVGARGPDYDLSVLQRCLVAGRAFWFYLGKLVWPANLSFVYPRWQPDAGDWKQWLYPVTAVGLLFALWRMRSRIGRGPVTALLLFVGTLSPLLGFVNVYFMRYSFVCDHWVYLPSLGPIALGAAGMSSLLQRRDRLRAIGPAIGGALLLTLGALTWRQAGMFADLETLWRTTIERDPGSWIAHNNLGNALARKGNTDEAIGQFREAIRLKPDLAEAYTSLGVALGMKGQIDDAIGRFRDAIRLRPDYPEAHYDLGIALGRKGRTDEAISEFREAIRLKPGFGAAQQSLANALRRAR